LLQRFAIGGAETSLTSTILQERAIGRACDESTKAIEFKEKGIANISSGFSRKTISNSNIHKVWA